MRYAGVVGNVALTPTLGVLTMSTPTVIRFAMQGDIIHQVITYNENGRLMAVYQAYRVYAMGKTVLHLSQPYLSEHGAILEWQSALYGISV